MTGERARFGPAINEMVGRGELRAPIVTGRDHLDEEAARRHGIVRPMEGGTA